ncbi:transglutaminase-like domain-containing protein [Ahniella affigens]|uniref:transglutaminase-like domain-containing protein n=1 Tax=Ahniella affigens TaxID=2021234 RepID=UPI00197DA8C3|nr:transglutaminase-like domain-containing protein [Ahniella affigens]
MSQNVRTAREHWRLYVRGARMEGDLQIKTEVRRGPDGILSASRFYQAGDVMERSDAQWLNSSWQIRMQQGADVVQTVGERPLERLPQSHPMAGDVASQFDALNFEVLPLRFGNDGWSDAEQLRRFQTDADGLMPEAVSLLGFHLTLARCTEAITERRRQTLDLDAASGLELPTVLTESQRAGKLGFEFQDVPTALVLPELTTQTARRNGERLAVVVCATCQLHAEMAPAPGPSATAPNTFVDSNHPAIIAQAAALRADTDRHTMQRLVRFVRRHLWDQTDTLGYASASQALLSAQGNCSEHALLLAALARANGIPTRIVHGLVYHPSRRHHEAALLPHLWVQAWIDGQWQHFDAGQKGYSAGHIALAISDGDPRSVNDQLTLILEARVQRVVALN